MQTFTLKPNTCFRKLLVHKFHVLNLKWNLSDIKIPAALKGVEDGFHQMNGVVEKKHRKRSIKGILDGDCDTSTTEVLEELGVSSVTIRDNWQNFKSDVVKSLADRLEVLQQFFWFQSRHWNEADQILIGPTEGGNEEGEESPSRIRVFIAEKKAPAVFDPLGSVDLKICIGVHCLVMMAVRLNSLAQSLLLGVTSWQ